MHIHYNTDQTPLPLEIACTLPSDHVLFTIEKVVNSRDYLVYKHCKLKLKEKEQIKIDMRLIPMANKLLKTIKKSQ
ncbi:hypothetical protein [Streptococcus porcinus]|uniref:Uncharacterized protein n=1 Tax=Streptococcus porcinus TaxID=1340 RepID=A0A7V9WPZ0_STRPO|nr:hypothetical protein [Streptococcus porcinus]MBA2794992.1 hypothetical protein [Streptococcus porcinus]